MQKHFDKNRAHAQENLGSAWNHEFCFKTLYFIKLFYFFGFDNIWKSTNICLLVANCIKMVVENIEVTHKLDENAHNLFVGW